MNPIQEEGALVQTAKVFADFKLHTYRDVQRKICQGTGVIWDIYTLRTMKERLRCVKLASLRAYNSPYQANKKTSCKRCSLEQYACPIRNARPQRAR